MMFAKMTARMLTLGVAGMLTVPLVAEADTAQIQILSAVVRDQKISDATLILQKNGAQSAVATTDGQGQATLSSDFADTADTLVIVKKAGYSTLVAKCPCKSMTYALSPVMTGLDGVRVVLNWGAVPSDLDLHVAFPNHHIFWNQKTDGASADANLDIDHIDSYGPETITLVKKHFGEPYVFAVHDYTDRNSAGTSRLARSNAKVMVYVGQSLVRSYYVPQGAVGNLWTVFRITADGEFQDINTVTGTNADASMVLGEVQTYLSDSTQVVPPSVSSSSLQSAKDINSQGEAAYHAGDLDGSIALYRQAIDMDPNYGQAYSNLGLAYQKSGRTSEAIWADRKAIALASGPTAATVRASSYYNIAKIYESAGQYQDALQHYQLAKAQKANPVYDKAIQRVRGLM